jgi:Cdc6-like AAA superfamily ATPase
MKDQKKIHLYADKPETGKDLKFAHKILANWLEKVISDVQAPFRIAITGKLGSGKSTIVHNALLSLEKHKDRYVVAYVDVWKLDQSSARRSTILRVAKEFGIDLESARYRKLHRSMYGSVSTIDNVKPIDSLANDVPFFKQMIFWYILFLAAGVFLAVYFLITNYADKIVADNVPEWLKLSLSGIVAASISVSNVISQKILQVKSSINQAPFVGPEEFEDAFQAILDAPELKDKKAIVVFDNIDRAPKSKTEEILTGISAFFDHSSGSTFRNLIILVPFSNLTNKELDESTVQKFFDAIIPIPTLMPEDLLDFTREKLIGVGWDNDADDVAQLVDRSDLKTPRAILHFVNEVAAQISLAESLETMTYRSEENAVVTYLSNGSLTKNKVFYAKLKLCERILPNFIWDALAEFRSGHDVFNPDNFAGYNPSDSKHDEQRRLFEFLRATEGIPERAPESLDQFVYFKGSDLELSVPGSAGVIEALNNRASEEIKNFYRKDKDIASLEKLFTYNFVRNKRNNLRMKNSIMAVLESFDSEIPSLSLRKELSRSVVKLKAAAYEIPIKELSKTTPESDGIIENESLWKHLDQVYLDLKKEPVGSTPDIETWRVDYLKHVLLQQKGLERTSLNSSDIKPLYVTNMELFEAMDKRGLKLFFGPTNLSQFLDFVEDSLFILPAPSLQNLGRAINVGIENSGKNVTGRITTYFNKMSEQLAGKISQPASLKELIDNLFNHLKHVVTLKVPEQAWATIADGLEIQTGHLNNLVPIAELELVSLLLVLNEKSDLKTRGNLLSFVRNFLNKSTIASFGSLTEKFGDWDWVGSMSSMLPVELEAKIQKNEISTDFAVQATGEGASFLVEKISILIALPNFEEIFQKVSRQSSTSLSKSDFIKEFYKKADVYSFEKAKIIYEYLASSDHQFEGDKVAKMVTHHLDKADEVQTAYLLEWCSRCEVNVVPMLNLYKEKLESENCTNWSDDDSMKFFAVLIGNPDRPYDFYVTLFNKAIERGIFSGSSSTTVKRVSATLERSWLNKKGVTAELLKLYRIGVEKSSHLQDDEKKSLLVMLENIAAKNNLTKELGFSKPNVVDKVTSLLIGKKDD